MMLGFHDLLFDPELVATEGKQPFPISGSPEFANTHIFNPKTGVVKTNIGRLDEIRKIRMKIALANAQRSAYFNQFWLGGYGSAWGFRFRYVPEYIVTREVFGIGDGVTTTFQLVVTNTRPGAATILRSGETLLTNVRKIYKPVVNTHLTNVGGAGGSVTLRKPDNSGDRVIDTAFKIYKDDIEATSGWTINNTTGLTTFLPAPSIGVILSWTGEWDIPVTFTGNTYTHNFDVPSEF